MVDPTAPTNGATPPVKARRRRRSKLPKPSERMTPMQRRFAEEYVHTSKIRESAKLAGYAHGVNGYHVIRHKLVAKYIADYGEWYRSTREINAAKVLDEIRVLAFSSLKRLTKLDGAGQPYFDFTDATIEDWRAIESLSVKTIPGADGVEVVETKVKLWNKPQSLKMLGMATGAIPTTVPVKAIEDPTALDQIESPKARLLAKLEAMARRLEINEGKMGPVIDVTVDEEPKPAPESTA